MQRQRHGCPHVACITSKCLCKLHVLDFNAAKNCATPVMPAHEDVDSSMAAFRCVWQGHECRRH
eukprot:1745553-Amphidinium_carterae.1